MGGVREKEVGKQQQTPTRVKGDAREGGLDRYHLLEQRGNLGVVAAKDLFGSPTACF